MNVSKGFMAAVVAVLASVSLLTGSVLGKDVVVAKKVKTPPSMDGRQDKVWKKAKRVKIILPGKYTVTAKAVYTDTDLYLLFQWPDKDESLNRVYAFKSGKWAKQKGNEDRFNILWPIEDSIKDFKNKGCQIACHQNKDTDEESMNTNRPGERGDLWHWKSQRTNPVGYADDQFLGHEVKTDDHETTGRLADSKKSGSYAGNWDDKTKRPKYTFSKGKGGPVLLKSKAKKVADGQGFTAGMVVPREVLERPKGSRGDISAKGIWKKKKWTLELGRALNSGQKDDVQFTDLSRPYYFGISVHNNAGGSNHATSKVVELQFK